MDAVLAAFNDGPFQAIGVIRVPIRVGGKSDDITDAGNLVMAIKRSTLKRSMLALGLPGRPQ
jgi:hypothetical protein